jgi:hypothetical protein
LLNDAGTAFAGPVTTGSAGTLENGKCLVSAVGSSVSDAGAVMTLRLRITFKPAFQGLRQIFAEALNGQGLSSGFRPIGLYNVSVTGIPPTALTVTPNSGSGTAGTFQFLFADPNGSADITRVQMLFHTTLSAVNGCLAYFDVRENRLLLLNDAGTAWLAVNPSTGTVGNSKCEITASGLIKTTSPNGLFVTLPVFFRAGFSATRLSVFGEATDAGGLSSGYAQLGAWNVP